jgi:hypothetical protein
MTMSVREACVEEIASHDLEAKGPKVSEMVEHVSRPS